MLSNLNLYDFLIIASYFIALEGVFGVPVLVYLLKKYSFEQNADLFRMLHSIGFDFNEDTKNEIKKARNSTQKAFIELRLYMHDGFLRQLKEMQKLNENDCKKQIKELIKYYESGEDKTKDKTTR